MNVAQRFNLYGDLILNMGLEDVGFRAQVLHPVVPLSSEPLPPFGDLLGPADILSERKIKYDNDSTPPNYDAGGNFDTSSNRYTAPNEGVYRFRASVEMTYLGENQYPIGAYKLAGWIRLFVNSDTNGYWPETINWQMLTPNGLIQYEGTLNSATFNNALQGGEYGNPRMFPWPGSKVRLSVEQSLFMEVGDYLEVKSRIFGFRVGMAPSVALFSINGSQFESIQTPTMGGQYTPFDPDAAYVNVYSADKIHLPEEVWESVRTNPVVGFRVNTGNLDPRIAFTKKISRKFVDGESELQLIYNRKQNHL